MLTALLIVSCGGEDEPSQPSDGSSSGKTDHGVNHKLLQIDYKDGYAGALETPFSNLTYDKENRLTSFNTRFSRFYRYEYNRDNIEIIIGSTQSDQKGLERSYPLKNGRIAGLCRYDSKNRLIAIERAPMSSGSATYNIEWTDGNITAVTYTSDATGKITQSYKIHYSDIPCESLMMCMGYLADTRYILMSPYSILYHIDPVLVEEGYYGNSMVKNLWSKIEYTSNSGTVTHRFNWENLNNGLPGAATTDWDPSGHERYYFTWAD